MTMEPEAALTAFGFNQLESLVYCELLRHSPATGYRLAHRTARVPANIYQALKALLQKGAVLVDSDSTEATSYVPIPPDQLLASLQAGYAHRADAALAALVTVHRLPREEVVSQLRTASQVIEQARSMLAKVRRTVMFDCMPEIYEILRPDFDGARSRGVAMAGIAYRNTDAEPTIPFKGEPPTAVGERWPGLGLILVTDASEQLVAQISRDMKQALNAVYSDSPFLSCIMHGLLQADIRLVALRTEGADSVPASPLDAFTLRSAHPPGFEVITQRVADLTGALGPQS